MDRALSGGDVASLIIPENSPDPASFQQRATALVEIAHRYDVAAIIVGDTRIAGRVKADGVHVETGKADAAAVLEKFGNAMMVGVGGARTRHAALELGETRPDYVFFGRIGYDTKPDPHPRNLALAEWWAELVEIPCVVMAGSDIASVADVARTGADFVALSAAVFAGGANPATSIEQANAILDREGPRFDV